MSPLANAIYKLLVRRLQAGRTSMTYGELTAALPPSLTTHRRSSRLHARLGEVSEACRASGVPCLPAMVWRADTGRPGPAYYRHAHPTLRAESSQLDAWEREHAAVIRAGDRYARAVAS